MYFEQNYNGAFYNLGRSGKVLPSFINCKFIGNRAITGAVIWNDGNSGTASPEFTNCLFTGNYARSSGGVIANIDDNGYGILRPKFINCTFVNNYAGFTGGVMWNTSNGVYHFGVIKPVLLTLSSGIIQQQRIHYFLPILIHMWIVDPCYLIVCCKDLTMIEIPILFLAIK
ncbi:MAG: hypothetical protein IPI77_13900 [Saprospiraceae bacterium]|nr:hypothetical protein [Saprospiraceae bacterium]